MRVGMIGLSEGNGHPFSFSAIVNGYSDEGFAQSNWPVIHDYLRRRRPDEFGFDDVRVTHVWTQDRAVTERLAAASKIDEIVDNAHDMIGKVDAVIIARDDVESHLPLALPFLQNRIATFVDKPLAVDAGQLEIFRPHLESGLLMSCSGLRFAAELDEARSQFASYGRILRIDGVVINGWQTYGVHMLDAVFGLITARPRLIQRVVADHDLLAVTLDDGAVLNIAALGATRPYFRLSIYGTEGEGHFSLRDNFSAFRRTLGTFFDMVRTGTPQLPPEDTMMSMRTIAAGLEAVPGGPALNVEDYPRSILN